MISLKSWSNGIKTTLFLVVISKNKKVKIVLNPKRRVMMMMMMMIMFDAFQKRLEQQNPKSSSEKFNHEEDTESAGSLQYGIYNNRSNSKQPEGLEKSDEPLQVGLDSAQHYKRGAQLSKFSNSLAWHGSSRLDHSKGNSSHWPEDRPNGKYHQLNDADVESSHQMDAPNCSYKKHEHPPGKVCKTYFQYRL